jgi:chemotaxis protein methyltransferase CheR
MLPPEKIKFFANYIEKELGIVYSDANYFQLQNRLEELGSLLNLGNAEQIWEQAQKGIEGHLKQALLDISTNNETSFFRDPKVFTAIEKGMIPEWITAKKNPVRIWSAASSNGQEPYTMAMLMEEAQKLNPTLNWEITATDIADKVIKRAQEARYTQLEIQRGLCAKRLVKYFEKTQDNFWTLKSDLRNRVRFQKQNLLNSFERLGKFDLILCRNVLIYQKVEGKQKIVERLADRLNPNGYLILGAGESLLGISDRFSMVNLAGAIFYQMRANSEFIKKIA